MICVCVCSFVSVNAHIHVCIETRRRCQVSSSIAFYLILFRGSLTELGARLSGSKLQLYSCLCFHGAEVTNTRAAMAFYISSGNLNSDPQTCIASVFNPSYFSSPLFSLIIISLIYVRLYLIAVLMSISLKPRETEHSFRYPLTTYFFLF